MGGAESLFGSSAGSVAVVALVLALLALGGVVLLLARQQRLLGQYQQLMTGTSGGNLEALLNDHVGTVHETAAQVAAPTYSLTDEEKQAIAIASQKPA
jgi:hypothetical protein